MQTKSASVSMVAFIGITACFMAMAPQAVLAQSDLPQTQPAHTPASRPAQTQPTPAIPMNMTTDLRTKLVPGTQARYRWTFENLDNVSVGPSPAIDRSRRIEMELLLRVPEAPSPDCDVELVYESMKTIVKSQSGVMEFDSSTPIEKDGENPMAAGYRPLIGLALKVKLDAAGNIMKLTGGESLLQGPPRNRQPRELFLEKDSVQRTFGTLFSSGRNDAQAPLAARWTSTDKYAFSQRAVVHLSNTHTLRAIAPETATIQIHGTVQPQPEGTPTAAAIQKQEGESNGQVIWNTNVGLLGRSEIVHNLKIDLETANVVVTNAAAVRSVLERVD
jgi:hypothetical protein